MGQLAYQLAYDAIEEWVAGRRPDFSQVWEGIVPSGGEWGYDQDTWESAATDIVNNFNDRLPVGQDVHVDRPAKRNSADRPLVDFQAYLAAKVDQINAAPVIASMELGDD